MTIGDMRVVTADLPRSNDSAIRRALHRKHLRHHRRCPTTIVIDELGLAHARCRVDIAVINGCVHGYEIKSDFDTLLRLPRQLKLYSGSLQKLTLVVGARHQEAVTTMLPHWAGLVVVRTGPRGGIAFQAMRLARTNPEVDPFLFAHLLWRGEAETALKELGVTTGSRYTTRRELYTSLVQTLSTTELAALISRSMRQRKDWRGLQRPP